MTTTDPRKQRINRKNEFSKSKNYKTSAPKIRGKILRKESVTQTISHDNCLCDHPIKLQM